MLGIGIIMSKKIPKRYSTYSNCFKAMFIVIIYLLTEHPYWLKQSVWNKIWKHLYKNIAGLVHFFLFLGYGNLLFNEEKHKQKSIDSTR